MLFSQEDNIKFDNVKVVKEFSATLGDFNKINIDPVLPVFDLKSRRYKYSVRSVPVRLEYEKPQIRPLALNTINTIEANKYFIKLGYGYPKYLKAQLSIGYKKKNTNSNFLINHISTDNSASLSDQKLSKTGLDFNFFNRKNELDLEYGLNTSIEGDYFYLYTPLANTDTLPYTNNKRRFMRGDIKGFFKKENLFNKIDNTTNINYKFLQINTSDKVENLVLLSNESKITVNENMHFIIPLYADLIFSKANYYIFGFQPKYIFNSKQVNIKLGGDIVKSQDNFYAYPYAELSLNIFHNFLEIFGSATNNIYNNSNFLITAENPFLNFDKDNTQTSVFNNYSGGVRSSLEGAKIEFYATYQRFQNKRFFINSSMDKRVFDIMYDNGTNIKLDVNASYKFIPQLEVSCTLTKNYYKMDNLNKAWFNPDFTANFTTKSYLFSDKLEINGELFFASQSWYQGLDGNAYKVDPLFDISAEAKYKLFTNSFVFAELNNIFAQQYQKWYQYPSLGLNFMGGIEIQF
jgi:hypothetical protein